MFFKKKTPVSKKAKRLPHTKKVQFVYLSPGELTQMLSTDITSVLTLTPVNYYAQKQRFYQCVFFYSDDYSEIMMQFELYENDRRGFCSEIYEIDRNLYSKILLKFGQRL